MASKWFVPELDKKLPKIKNKVPQYQRYFEFLETDKELPSGIKEEHKMRGLALPFDVLEKIKAGAAVPGTYPPDEKTRRPSGCHARPSHACSRLAFELT